MPHAQEFPWGIMAHRGEDDASAFGDTSRNPEGDTPTVKAIPLLTCGAPVGVGGRWLSRLSASPTPPRDLLPVG